MSLLQERILQFERIPAHLKCYPNNLKCKAERITVETRRWDGCRSSTLKGTEHFSSRCSKSQKTTQCLYDRHSCCCTAPILTESSCLSHSNQQAFLLENVPCNNASCEEVHRMFKVYWDLSGLNLIKDAMVATFFDIYEDVSSELSCVFKSLIATYVISLQLQKMG